MPEDKLKLDTSCKNTWCPGCGDFGILQALKQAVSFFSKKGVPKDNFVITSGIGCHAKIVDYINTNTFYALHGRSVTTAAGIKLGNPALNVIACSGDGDSYDEGIAHLIHNAKRNIDITVLIHNNRIFALTTGQFAATSPKGFPGKSTPDGSVEEPFNPLELMLASGATFIARSYVGKMDHLQKTIIEGVKHKGFSFIEILQPCVSFYNSYQLYNKNVYEAENPNLESRDKALAKIMEWNYGNGESDAKIPIGTFYKIQKPTYEKESFGDLNPLKRKKDISIEEVINSHI